MTTKDNIIEHCERRERVFRAILLKHLLKGSAIMDFDRLVEISEFSRSEVASHVGALTRHGRIHKDEDGEFFHDRRKWSKPRIARFLALINIRRRGKTKRK